MHFLILGCVLGAACSIMFYEHPIAKKMQFISFDAFNKLYPREPTNQVVVVDIDESSLNTLGQWPWPRHVVGQIVKNLTDMGAKVIAFDMVFAEKDRTSPSFFAKDLPPEYQSKELSELLSEMPNNDEVFGQMIKKSGRVVTAFTAAKENETRRPPLLRRKLQFKKDNEAAINDLKKHVYHLKGAATNLPVISKYAAGSGAFMAQPEDDGIIRKIPIILRFKDKKTQDVKLYSALSLETARVGVNRRDYLKIGRRRNFNKIGDKENYGLSVFDTTYFINIGSSALTVPLSSDGYFWVHYRPRDTKNYISAYKAYDSHFFHSIRNKIKGKYVFIASSAEGLKDLRSTPLNVFVPGVEVHLNVLEQILQQRFLTRPQSMKSAEILAVLSAGLLMILLAPFINSLILAFICATVVFVFWVGAFWSYIELGVLIDPLFSSISVVLLFFSSVLFSYLRSESERQSVRDAFGFYISPDFMAELTKSPDKLTLGGEIRELTVLFSDIRNFTTISENMSPEVLINTMNDFLTPMSDEVMRYRGTIDKYMGDAMMAFFNAPLDDSRHTRHACEAALAMVDALAPVNEKVKAKAEEDGRPFHRLNAGIGINTGPCAVGNMGSRTRFAYSALGDAVNLASRLEGQTKNYGINILVGEDTARQVPEFAWLEMDLIRVKGKETPVRVYFLYGGEDIAASASFKKWQKLHNDFLANYRLQNFDIALKIIEKCRVYDSENVLEICYDIYELRIEAFKVNPPSREWDGVYIATTK